MSGVEMWARVARTSTSVTHNDVRSAANKAFGRRSCTIGSLLSCNRSVVHVMVTPYLQLAWNSDRPT